MSIVLSVVVVAILPGQQASAKQCKGTSCKHDQHNSENHRDDSSTNRKDKIPFRLPFP
jgi:hypothetical protein